MDFVSKLSFIFLLKNVCIVLPSMDDSSLCTLTLWLRQELWSFFCWLLTLGCHKQAWKSFSSSHCATPYYMLCALVLCVLCDLLTLNLLSWSVHRETLKTWTVALTRKFSWKKSNKKVSYTCTCVHQCKWVNEGKINTMKNYLRILRIISASGACIHVQCSNNTCISTKTHCCVCILGCLYSCRPWVGPVH